jgi:hypothetical protein
VKVIRLRTGVSPAIPAKIRHKSHHIARGKIAAH